MSDLNLSRCTWPGNDELMNRYHDEEWGTPLHDDTNLFEFMVLDAFQAGLSWKTVLYKREAFRKAFSNYDVSEIAGYNEGKIAELIADQGIIRNKQKIVASVSNAAKFLEVKAAFGTFDKYIWQFTDYRTIKNSWRQSSEIPAKSVESEAMSKDLIKRGFKFVGPTICYAFMQAAGMVNDHLIGCPRHAS